MGMDAPTGRRPSRSAFAFALLLLAILIAAGCTPQRQTGRPLHTEFSDHARSIVPPEPTAAWPSPIEPRQITLGESVSGRPITGMIYGDGEQTILILASIHGNESVGTPLVRKLGAWLVEHPDVLADKRVLLVPVANPDGMSVSRRTNLHGVDLNRNFPAWNYSLLGGHGSGALSEPESRALYDVIVKYSPRRIISIHQPLTCIDYDGPGEGLARAMAATARLPFKKLGSLAGSLGSFAGVNRRIPVVTVEFPRGANDLTADGLWSRYGRMLLVGICYPAPVPTAIMARGPESPRPTPQSPQPPDAPDPTLAN